VIVQLQSCSSSSSHWSSSTTATTATTDFAYSLRGAYDIDFSSKIIGMTCVYLEPFEYAMN